jgi:hypothetical protein
MRQMYAVAGMIVVMLVVGGAASADVFGVGPSLGGKKPLVAEQRGASGPLPSTILGLEGYALWGKNAGSAGAVTLKRRFGSTPIGSSTIRWRMGLIGGIEVEGSTTNPLYGGFIEGEMEGLVGLVLVVRADDGIYVNPGIKVNALSVSW